MALPDYHGGSIVNLMSSLIQATGGHSLSYPVLDKLGPQELSEHRNIVLLVLDGLGYQYLSECRQGCLSQHLRAKITSVFPSTTASAITTYLTGDAPQQHALTGWFMYFKELGAVMTVLRGTPRYGGVGFTRSGVDAGRLFGHIPVFDRVRIASHIVTPRDIAYSDFNTVHTGAAKTHAYQTLQELFDVTLWVIRQRTGRKFVYAYWPGLDRIGHDSGIASDAATAHFKSIDEQFERFLRQLKGTDTLVVATADHGMIDVTPDQTIELDDHPQLAACLTLPLCGERRVAYCYVRTEHRDAFQTYVRQELNDHAELWESRDLIARNYFGLGEPHPRLAERIGDYTLVMKNNFVIKDWLPGEPRHVQVGVHGGTSDSEMYVPLIVARA